MTARVIDPKTIKYTSGTNIDDACSWPIFLCRSLFSPNICLTISFDIVTGQCITSSLMNYRNDTTSPCHSVQATDQWIILRMCSSPNSHWRFVTVIGTLIQTSKRYNKYIYCGDNIKWTIGASTQINLMGAIPPIWLKSPKFTTSIVFVLSTLKCWREYWIISNACNEDRYSSSMIIQTFQPN
jgi:hypothetical protein